MMSLNIIGMMSLRIKKNATFDEVKIESFVKINHEFIFSKIVLKYASLFSDIYFSVKF